MSKRKGKVTGCHDLAQKRAKSASTSQTSTLLPDPASMQKLGKSTRKVFRDLQALDLLSESKICSYLTEDQKVCWLIQQFGWSKISQIAKSLQSVPASVTSKQRSSIVSSQCSHLKRDDQSMPQLELLVSFLEDECPDFVDSFPPNESTILSPPLCSCPRCDRQLVSYHQCSVTLYCVTGVTKALKITLRCQHCTMFFGYSKFGNKDVGFRFYDDLREYIEVTDTVFMERKLLEFQCGLANHSWVSFQGFAEAYNDAHNVHIGLEITPKIAAKAFWVGETELELRRLNKVDFMFVKDDDIEKAMEEIEEKRRLSLYEHLDCSEACQERGCGQLWVTDGIWSLCYPHCMYQMKHSVQGIPYLNLPDVCTENPKHGQAFCATHCQFLKDNAPGVPTGLREFLRHCGLNSNGQDQEESYDPKDIGAVDVAISKLPESQEGMGEAAATAQGISSLIEDHPALVSMSQPDDLDAPLCRKDVGKGKRLRRWSRGHQFVVRGGGHIDTWSPLYKSESPSQVFIILIQWLLTMAKTNDSGIVTLAYDNMCNLDKLKASKQLLPFEPPINKVWHDVKKIIDVFHFANHVSPACKEKYSPDKVKKAHPHWNTQAGEQTFTWLSRFKHIVCSMPKTHHLFYIHRMVMRRNEYTSKCYKNGRKPILPKSLN